LITGLIFVLVYLFLYGDLRFMIYDLRFFVTFGYYLFILSGLIVVFFADIKYGIIPDKIIFPAIVASLLYLFIIPNSLFSPRGEAGMIHILSAIGAFLFFLFLFLITKGRGMGFGDVKLVFLLGLILGFPKIVAAFYIAFLTGAILGCILILWGKKKLTGGTIPFGPFLVLGAIIAMFWGTVLH
jgi:prepilin signal peptidase PulO-like enzyme (type II secretory pathway)